MQKKPREHALAVVKAALAAVPTVGGVLASLIGDYIPTATEKAKQRAWGLLKNRLKELGDRIDAEAVNKDEFSELFKSCYLTIVRTHQESKLRAAANLIANILLRDGDAEKLSYTELDHFVRCVDSLSAGAIDALGHIVEMAEQRAPRKFGEKNIQVSFGEVHGSLPHYPPDLLMGLLSELNSFHLIYLTGVPSIRTEQYSNYPLELPPLGVRFVTHVLRTGG